MILISKYIIYIIYIIYVCAYIYILAVYFIVIPVFIELLAQWYTWQGGQEYLVGYKLDIAF